MKLTLTRTAPVPLHDSTLERQCAVAAREALQGDVGLQEAHALCEYLDLPDTVEADLPADDPLRFCTVRLLGFLRNNWWKPTVANLASASPTAERLLKRVRQEDPTDS